MIPNAHRRFRRAWRIPTLLGQRPPNDPFPEPPEGLRRNEPALAEIRGKAQPETPRPEAPAERSAQVGGTVDEKEIREIENEIRILERVVEDLGNKLNAAQETRRIWRNQVNIYERRRPVEALPAPVPMHPSLKALEFADKGLRWNATDQLEDAERKIEFLEKELSDAERALAGRRERLRRLRRLRQ